MSAEQKAKVTKSAKRSRKKSAAKPESKGTCFVMMPFREPFNFYYEDIFKPAIAKAKLEPVRVDDLFRPSAIVGDLWQMIQDAEVLIAEMTTRSSNVFYELGLAHAIGKPVVLVSETMDDVPFDLQPLRVLTYDKNDPSWGDKLRESITRSILETLDSKVEAVPTIFRKTVPSQAPRQDATVARLDALESKVRRLLAGVYYGPHELESEASRNLFTDTGLTTPWAQRTPEVLRGQLAREQAVEFLARLRAREVDGKDKSPPPSPAEPESPKTG